MVFEYDITAADVTLAQTLSAKVCRDKVQQSLILRILRAMLILAGVLAVVEMVGLAVKYRNSDFSSDVSWVVWSALAFVVIFATYTREYQKRFLAWRESELAPLPVKQKLLINTDGLVVESRFGKVEYRWTAIRTLTGLKEHFAFTTAAASVVIIPYRMFASLEERNSFEAEMRSHL